MGLPLLCLQFSNPSVHSVLIYATKKPIWLETEKLYLNKGAHREISSIFCYCHQGQVTSADVFGAQIPQCLSSSVSKCHPMTLVVILVGVQLVASTLQQSSYLLLALSLTLLLLLSSPMSFTLLSLWLLSSSSWSTWLHPIRASTLQMTLLLLVAVDSAWPVASPAAAGLCSGSREGTQIKNSLGKMTRNTTQQNKHRSYVAWWIRNSNWTNSNV